jgi:hypothetical protein
VFFALLLLGSLSSFLILVPKRLVIKARESVWWSLRGLSDLFD